MTAARQQQQQHLLLAAAGVVVTVAVAGLYYHHRISSKDSSKDSSSKTKSLDDHTTTKPASAADTRQRRTVERKLQATPSSETLPTNNNSNNNNNNNNTQQRLHSQIENLDKKGKALFKNKQFLEAAEVFTEALDLIQGSNSNASSSPNSSLTRQAMTLLNNRSAMYEKAGHAALALQDCATILADYDAHHGKARTRQLRLLEQTGAHRAALTQVCAAQLLFLQRHRDQLRARLPVPPPPVNPAKLQELLTQHVLPAALKDYQESAANQNEKKETPPPSPFTIQQLLRSYSEYETWRAVAATTTNQVWTERLKKTSVVTEKAPVLLGRGRRAVYDGNYPAAATDFEEAVLLCGDARHRASLTDTEYTELMEWTGLTRHFRYQLDAALEAYAQCGDSQVPPRIQIKMAGVHMDAGRHDKATALLDAALETDPSAVDALLHRSNLFMMQQEPAKAQADLEAIIALQPRHVMARLRLASILAAQQVTAAAEEHVRVAEAVAPESSEVVSYRGELHFAAQEMTEAYQQFAKAIRLEPNNPTPYVNAAMALLNTPPTEPGAAPDTAGVIQLLEKAVQVDPQCTSAYVQLGQVKLGTATDLTSARVVVELYNTGLQHCRSDAEVAELLSMRILAEAQVEAAESLGMESFSMA